MILNDVCKLIVVGFIPILFDCSCSWMLNIWCIKMRASSHKQAKKQQSNSSPKTYTRSWLATLQYRWGIFGCNLLLSLVVSIVPCNKTATSPNGTFTFVQRRFPNTSAPIQPSRDRCWKCNISTGTMQNAKGRKLWKRNIQMTNLQSNPTSDICTHTACFHWHFVCYLNEWNSWHWMLGVALQYKLGKIILVTLKSVLLVLVLLFPSYIR